MQHVGSEGRGRPSVTPVAGPGGGRSIVIVDAYSSGNLLAPLFRARGYRLVHVQSQDPIPEIYRPSFQPHDFDVRFLHRSVEETLGRLRGAGIAQVLPGIEIGVELADTLSEALGTLTNGTPLSAARRDKWLMVQALEAAGVRAIPSAVARAPEEALGWAGTRYPVVAKPRRSAGTDNVWFCAGPPELERAFHRILGERTALCEVSDSALVQEYVSGTEYIVDTVRHGDVTAVTEICRYRKQVLEGGIVYDLVELLPATGAVQDRLAAYAISVLDALHIRFGPAHLEIMMDERGPVLVEVGARLDGTRAPELCEAATNQNQATMSVLCYADPHEFERRARVPYSLHKHLLRVHLISARSGTITAVPFLDDVKGLPSFHSITKMLGPGDRVRRTTGLVDLPGIVDLAHPCRDTVWADYRRIRDWERQGFFELTP